MVKIVVKKTDVNALVKEVKNLKIDDFSGLKEMSKIVNNYDGEEGELLKAYRDELKDGVASSIYQGGDIGIRGGNITSKKMYDKEKRDAGLKDAHKWYENLAKKMKENKELKNFADKLVRPVLDKIDEFKRFD